MAIELHDAGNGETFRTTTDFLECDHCSSIIPNKTRADGVVVCGTCGSEWAPDEVADARVEEIVQAVVDSANLRDILRLALADLKTASTWTSDNNFEESIMAAKAALGEE